MVREALGDELLTGYELQSVSHTTAAVAIVDVNLRVGGEEIEGAMRWIRHGEDGMAVAPNEAWSLGTHELDEVGDDPRPQDRVAPGTPRL